MDKRPPSRKGSRDQVRKERRASAKAGGLGGAVNLLRNLWARPLGLQRAGRGVKVVLVDRRRPPSPDAPPPMSEIRAELRERLLAHNHAHAAQVMRHLAVVHDELGRAGWAAVENLPGQVLAMAVVQAEMLASEAPSPIMNLIVERLRLFKVAADVRVERGNRIEREAREITTIPTPVSEAKATEVPAPKDAAPDDDGRTWGGPVPVPLVIPDREK